MVVYVNLDRPLVSQILINGKTQRVEYEFLPIACLHYGRYGHMKEACIFRVSESSTRKESPSSKTLSENQSMVMNDKGEKCETYGPWMLVEKKSRRKSKDPSQLNAGNPTKKKKGS
ncbi:hypothetical protein Goarm_003809, partial [Gossypium armourianum]|nr:hypothetical protein [Gossypium armourianum]